MARQFRIAVLAGAVAGCGAPGGDPDKVSPEELDPQQCAGCHPVHHQQWLSSMHAYAADDPVFVAMNARGQRETNGELGDFCVSCHAPVAVLLGETHDGLNLGELPSYMKGVTCYFCHQVDAIEGTHNNPLRLAYDSLMRGAIPDALETDAHATAYSAVHDQRSKSSAQMCGACHDIVNPNGVHIERTFAEWEASLFAIEDDAGELAAFGQTCGLCHMRGESAPVADVTGARERVRHQHHFAAVDVALTPFPDSEQAPALEAIQREAIADTRDTVVCSAMCVQPDPGGAGAQVAIWLHNEAAGHGWPSGATADRRAWVEVRAFDPAEFWQSGVVADDESVDELVDPNLWLFRDRLYDGDGRVVHMFWEAESYESSQLGVPADLDEADDDAVWAKHVYPLDRMPERVTSRLRLRPVAFEVVDDLIASGDLDPGLRVRFETFEIPPSTLEWTPAAEAVAGLGTCATSASSCVPPEIRDAG